LPGVAGCLEHAAKMLAAMKDAKENMRSMCVSFLDLAGAYPSVAHSLVQFALRWYHFPDWLSKLLFNYYECLCARVVTAEWESDLFTFLIGVFQGCTASVVIFLVVFQVLLDYHAFKAFALVYRFKQDPELLLRDPAFADDVALVSATAAENQLSIDIFQEILDWTITMLLKASKCRSWAIGRVSALEYRKFTTNVYSVYDPKLKVKGEVIMCIADDKEASLMFKLLLEGWLARVDGCSLPGAYKVWIVNYVVYSRLVWHLVVYDVPDTVVRGWRHQCVRMFKKWLGVTRS
ncbi:unnamed protein product, partial [Heterosigma akashiwo]